MSFQSMYSSFSAQNLQTLRRRTKNFLRGPPFRVLAGGAAPAARDVRILRPSSWLAPFGSLGSLQRSRRRVGRRRGRTRGDA